MGLPTEQDNLDGYEVNNLLITIISGICMYML